MGYGISDSSGTDDDLPPTHRNRFQSGARVTGNGRPSVIGPASLPRIHSDMETQIHAIEQEAYSSVLRAFRAQSDALTWEKEGLISQLRQELRMSDEEHREILARVDADDVIRRIREWRKASGVQHGFQNTSQPVHDSIPSPTVSASHKKHRTSQPVACLPAGAPAALHSSMQPSTSALGRGPLLGSRNKKLKTSMQYPTTGLPGNCQVTNRSSGPFMNNEPTKATSYDPLIGRKVWTRWPDDNNFYEAEITNFNPVDGRYSLVYDKNTDDETWEWVNLKEIPLEDIRWEGEDPGVYLRGGRPGSGRGNKKSMTRGGVGGAGMGRGRGTMKSHYKKDLSQNGIARKPLGDIEMLHTDTLIKEVEKVFSSAHPDPTEVEKAKKVLEEQERALIAAITRIEDASDGESGEQPFSQQLHDQGWRKRPYSDIVMDAREGAADSNKIS